MSEKLALQHTDRGATSEQVDYSPRDFSRAAMLAMLAISAGFKGVADDENSATVHGKVAEKTRKKVFKSKTLARLNLVRRDGET